MTYVFLLVGCITWYAGPYVSQPLRCGGVYDETCAWIAIDIDKLDGWECNDLVTARIGGELYHWRILDSGPLSRFCVWYGYECLPIIGDLPKHIYPAEGLSARATIWNVSLIRRRLSLER